jgi:hypothetical protein
MLINQLVEIQYNSREENKMSNTIHTKIKQFGVEVSAFS